MTRLALHLSLASISRNPRRFWTQALVTMVVVIASCGALATTRTGTLNLSEAVTESGALVYSLDARDPASGDPSYFSLEVVDLIAEADNVDSVVAVAAIAGVSPRAPGGKPDSSVVVLAVNSSFLEAEDYSVVAGLPPFARLPAGNGRQAVVGLDIAKKFGLTRECVLGGACRIEIGSESMSVGTVADFDSPALDNSILLSLGESVDAGLTRGASTMEVSSPGLPTGEVARSLDLLASTSGKTVFVTEPKAAGQLRDGMARSWRGTVIAVSFVLLILGTAAQVAFQAASVRFRRSEIAVLRSLGCSSTMVRTQFTVEPAIISVAGGLLGLVISASLARASQRLGFAVLLPYGDAMIVTAATVVAAISAAYLVARTVTRVLPSEALST